MTQSRVVFENREQKLVKKKIAQFPRVVEMGGAMEKVGESEKKRERGDPGYCCYISGPVNIFIFKTHGPVI